MNLDEPDIEAMERVLAMIQNSKGRSFSVEELSKLAGMSETRFKIVFRFYTGRPVFVFQKTRQLNLAYSLVTGSRHPLKQVAAMCGYKYISHFNADFRSRFLVSAFRLRRGK
jgi:transcriptional regulator GlxA family with amidase domain